MSRCFRILGLRDDATRDQVVEAYERKVDRYKGPDYAEERAYAEKKLRELHAAYEEAYRLAEPGNRGNGRTRRSSVEEKSSIGKNDWKLKKPDFAKLKEKMSDLVQEDESSVRDVAGSSAAVEQRLGEEGPAAGKLKKVDSGGAIVSVISILVAVFVAITGSCGSDDVAYEDDYSDGQYIYDYSYDEVLEDDSNVAELALDSQILLYEQESYDEEGTIEEIEEDYIEQADAFAQNYWGMESVDEVTDHLYTNYWGYTTDSDGDLDEQLESIFMFYDFMCLEEASWYQNPYTGEEIDGYGDYLDYLNQYYEEAGV